MSVVSGDIRVYGSANMQEGDVGVQGGAIDTTTWVLFDSATLVNSPAGSSSIMTIVSTQAGEKTSVYITGRNPGGSIVGDTIALNGITPVNGSIAFERLLKIGAVGHSGTITIKDSNTAVITTIPSGISYVRRPFYDVSSDVAGGATRNYYEKVFIKNTGSPNSLLGATVCDVAGGVATGINWALELAQNMNGTSVSRVTAPSTGVGTFVTDYTASGIPGTDLASGAAIGLWMNLILVAGATAAKDVYTIAISWSTT